MKPSASFLALACAAALASHVATAQAEDAPTPPAFRSAAYPWDIEHPGTPRVYAPEFESPQSALNRLEKSYRELDLELYGSLLTADYRFITGDPRFDREYPEGFDRLTDLGSMAGLFNVDTPPNRLAVTMIEFDLGLVGEGTDPDHPDSLDHYRLLIAPNPAMTVHAGTPEEPAQMQMTRSLLAFYMVRGDAAVLPDGAPATDGVWYLRRWVETPPEQPAPGDAGGVQAAARASFALAENPARGPFQLLLTLPARQMCAIELFDVTGRSMHRRPAAAFEAGTTRLELTESASLPAGIYWVRVMQESRELGTRVVTKL